MATTQQQQCYAAEATVGNGRTFASVDEIQRFVDALRDEPWWRAQGYGRKVLRVEVGKADGRILKSNGVGFWDETKSAGRIELRPGGMHERLVLHEVAHVIARANHGSKSHDPWWARTYLTLVSYVMGSDAYLALQSAFDREGVDYAAPTGRPGVIAL